jgi:hypothetical protein
MTTCLAAEEFIFEAKLESSTTELAIVLIVIKDYRVYAAP